MIKSLLRLSLGLAMILAVSTVLFVTDRPRPRTGGATSASGTSSSAKVWSVALLQHISQPTIEEGARGVLAGLAASGYRDGETIRLRRFNAEGDAATSNTIARE